MAVNIVTRARSFANPVRAMMDVERSTELRLSRAMGRALSDFSMIEEGDRVMVCVSGGKDSYTMLSLLESFRRKSPVKFSLIVVNIDQGQPNFPADILANYMKEAGYDYRPVFENTYAVVKEKVPEGKTYCSLCSRLRRGILYRVASEYGCTKIALGHHRDDVLQTLMLNMLYAGKLGAMPPRLNADEGRHTVIRPLVYCDEADIRDYAKVQAFPILPCDLCGSQENLKRKVVGRMLDQLERETPGTKQVMLASLQNVVPSHLLDKGLWAKLGIHASDEEKDAQQGLIPASSLIRRAIVEDGFL